MRLAHALLWQSLHALGWVAAAPARYNSFGGAAAGSGFCGVGPGGAYGVAAELCGGPGVDFGGGWQQAGAEMQDWGAAAVQHGRRFGA
jgi:hypothetical protein